MNLALFLDENLLYHWARRGVRREHVARAAGQRTRLELAGDTLRVFAHERAFDLPVADLELFPLLVMALFAEFRKETVWASRGVAPDGSRLLEGYVGDGEIPGLQEAFASVF